VSDYFERWQVLAALISKEHDPEKVTTLANEMNRVLTQRTVHLDPPPHPQNGSQKKSQLSSEQKWPLGK
jgi:hypothetical protein